MVSKMHCKDLLQSDANFVLVKVIYINKRSFCELSEARFVLKKSIPPIKIICVPE